MKLNLIIFSKIQAANPCEILLKLYSENKTPIFNKINRKYSNIQATKTDNIKLNYVTSKYPEIRVVKFDLIKLQQCSSFRTVKSNEVQSKY